MREFSEIGVDSIVSEGFGEEDIFICISNFIVEPSSFHEIMAKSRKQCVLTMRRDEKQAAIDYALLAGDVTNWVYQSSKKIEYLYDRCDSIRSISEQFNKYYCSDLRPKLDKIEYCHFGESEEEGTEEFFMQLEARTLTVTIWGH